MASCPRRDGLGVSYPSDPAFRSIKLSSLEMMRITSAYPPIVIQTKRIKKHICLLPRERGLCMSNIWRVSTRLVDRLEGVKARKPLALSASGDCCPEKSFSDASWLKQTPCEGSMYLREETAPVVSSSGQGPGPSVWQHGASPTRSSARLAECRGLGGESSYGRGEL